MMKDGKIRLGTYHCCNRLRTRYLHIGVHHVKIKDGDDISHRFALKYRSKRTAI